MEPAPKKDDQRLGRFTIYGITYFVCCVGLENYDEFQTRSKYNVEDLVRSNVPCDPSKLPEITKKIEKYYFDSLGPGATEKERFERFMEVRRFFIPFIVT